MTKIAKMIKELKCEKWRKKSSQRELFSGKESERGKMKMIKLGASDSNIEFCSVC